MIADYVLAVVVDLAPYLCPAGFVVVVGVALARRYM